jgi:3-oxocholest-4-en-26-oyl-CoA dehydrogenase beta subunit
VDFSLAQSQVELSALASSILADRATPERLAEVERTGEGLDADLWARLATAGVIGAALPESAGGDGFGLAEQCSVLTAIGRAVAPVPYLETVVLGAGAIARFGSAGQIARWARSAVTGRLIIAAALAEPGADDPRAPSAHAERADGAWRLSGAKTAVQAGVPATLFLVPATTDSGPAVFCVERADPGVSAEPQQLVGGDGAVSLVLADVEIGDDRRLGTASDAVASWLADRATVGICAHQLGVTQRALELTAEHARNRQQFGRAIGAFQAVAQRLADAYIDVEAIRLTMWQAAWRLEAGLPCDEEIATAKFWAAEAGHRVAHTAVHIHGGVGIDISHPLHRYFTAAKQNEFALGGATAQLRRLGAALASGLRE